MSEHLKGCMCHLCSKHHHFPAVKKPESSFAAPTGSTPVEQRISHRIMVYSAQRAPHMMNQFTIEDIVKEEMTKESNGDSTTKP